MEAITAIGGDPPPDWTMSKARLLARTPELTALLTSELDAPVLSERMLEDDSRALRGTPDIVVLARATVLIDLKTETLAADEVPPWVRFQLTIYAHLIAQRYGTLPAQIEIFSLNRGRIPVAITATDVAVALDAVERARASEPSDAHPEPDTCRFCQRRLGCEPHWEAASEWPQPDCVEGTIEHIERAANGLTAIRVRSRAETEWISGIPTPLVMADVGSTVRVVRVYRRQTPEADQHHWRWSALSSLAVPASLDLSRGHMGDRRAAPQQAEGAMSQDHTGRFG
jgi:hypothetical protein